MSDTSDETSLDLLLGWEFYIHAPPEFQKQWTQIVTASSGKLFQFPPIFSSEISSESPAHVSSDSTKVVIIISPLSEDLSLQLAQMNDPVYLVFIHEVSLPHLAR